MPRSEVFSRAVLRGLAVCCMAVLSAAVIRGSGSTLPYVGSAVGLTIVAIASRLKPNSRVNVALVVLALGVSAYMAEGALFVFERGHYSRFMNFEANRISVARSQGAPFDTRTRLEFLDDLEDDGVDAVARIHPGLFAPTNGLIVDGERIFPLSGLSRHTTVSCNESGEWSVIETDEHGFRNPAGVFDVDTMDIVVIGDSYAFGSCTKEGEDAPSVLRRNGRHVLNLAYGGNGPMTMVASLKEYGEPLTPRVVLWFYYEGNDLHNLRTEQDSPLLMEYLDPTFTQQLMGRRGALDRALEDFYAREKALARRGEVRRTRCVVWLCGLRNLFRRPLDPGRAANADGDMVPLLGEIVSATRDRVHGWGGEFYFVYLPAWSRYNRAASEDPTNREAVMSTLREAEIEIIDFVAELDAHPDPLSLFPFRVLGHYTAEGYALLARQIEDRLARAAADAAR